MGSMVGARVAGREAGRTPNAFKLIIVAPFSRLEAAAERQKCGSRLERSSLTRQAIF